MTEVLVGTEKGLFVLDEWAQAEGMALPERGEQALQKLWILRLGEADGTIYPADPDSAYVIPLAADMDRVTPDGRVRMYETRDAGETWTPRGDGLPQPHASLTILR